MTDRRKLGQFRQRAAEILGIRQADVIDLFRGARATSARVNRLHADSAPDELTGKVRSLVPVSWCRDAFFCTGELRCTEMVPFTHDGSVYLQNASSLIPVVALDPCPGERIIDVSAAPGGKAFHIAARVANDCDLWLNDASKPRAEKLRHLAELYGVRYSHLTTEPAQYIDKSLPTQSFDRILLDVQCSGEGRIDLRRSDALRYWSTERIEKYKYLQTKMLDAAYRLLRPGGTIVYSTCTFAPEENEYPVSQVLGRHADLDLAPIEFRELNFRPGLTKWRSYRFDPRLERAVRVVPDDMFEGFFTAKLIRLS